MDCYQSEEMRKKFAEIAAKKRIKRLRKQFKYILAAIIITALTYQLLNNIGY